MGRTVECCQIRVGYCQRLLILEKMKVNKMAYTAYEVKRTKQTPTGTSHLVKCNYTGKYAICSWVGSTGSAIGGIKSQGKLGYVMKKWKEIVGNYVPRD